MNIMNVSVLWNMSEYNPALFKQNVDTQKTAILQSIDGKIKSGGKLSSAERAYLQMYAPDIFDVVSRIRMEHAAIAYDRGAYVDVRG